MIKRSVQINGHPTSLSLEAAFWDELRRQADMRGQSLAGLIAEIDASRMEAGQIEHGLSRAVRLWVFHQVQAERDALKPQTEK